MGGWGLHRISFNLSESLNRRQREESIFKCLSYKEENFTKGIVDLVGIY